MCLWGGSGEHVCFVCVRLAVSLQSSNKTCSVFFCMFLHFGCTIGLDALECVSVCVCVMESIGVCASGAQELQQWEQQLGSRCKLPLTSNSTWLLGNRTALLHIGSIGEGGGGCWSNACVSMFES